MKTALGYFASAILLATIPSQVSASDAGLVHRWKLDEPAGNVAVDSVGGAHGSISTLSNRVAGRIGSGAISIGGFDSFVDFGSAVDQFGTSDFTVAFWIATTVNPANSDLVGDRVSGSHGNFVQFRLISGGRVVVEVDNHGADYVPLISPVSSNDGNWHHVAVTRTGTIVKLYIDGVERASGGAAGVTNVSNGAPFRLGQTYAPLAYPTMPASYDDVRIYNLGLSANEVADLSAGTEPTLEQLVADLVTDPDVVSGLQSKLESIANADAKGNLKAKANVIKAFINQVNAQTGKSISPEDAALFIQMVQNL